MAYGERQVDLSILNQRPRPPSIAAYPVTRGYDPSDLGATIYSALGVDPASPVADRLGRPMRLNKGEVTKPLFIGSPV